MFSDKNYPKVLFISHTPFSNTGMGKTYSSLFRNWPNDRIAQLFFNEGEIPSFEICNNYFRVTDKQLMKGLLFNNREKYCRNSVTNMCPVARERKFHSKLKLSQYRDNLMLFRDLLWLTNYWKTNALYEWVEKFDADVIFFIGAQSGFSHRIVHSLANKYHLPMFVYFTDDYYISPSINNPLKYLQYYFNTKINIEKSVIMSKVCFAIGDLMSNEYKSIFNKQFIPIMNSIDFDIDMVQESSTKEKNSILLSYIGGLHSNRWESLVYLGSLLREIQKDELLRVSLEICTLDAPSKAIIDVLNTAPLVYKGPIDSERIQQHKSDILVHVESVNKECRKTSKYSVSTKISEYLSSGNCVLAYGPEEVASIRMIKDNNLGIVLREKATIKENKAILLNVIKSIKLRSDYGRRGYDFAVKNFNAANVRELIRATLFDNVISSDKK